MANDLELEKGAAIAHLEISPSENLDGGNGIMGTTQLNVSEEILLVPAPSADPRGKESSIFQMPMTCSDSV